MALIFPTQSLLARVPSEKPSLIFNLDFEKADICYPEYDMLEPLPPCIQIAVFDDVCQPWGPELTGLAHHQDCLCNSTYFIEDWPGCQDCLYTHGYHSERDHEY